MFNPNRKCLLQLSSGKTDVYGQPTPSTYVEEGCTIVSMMINNTKSTVRADSSASRGSAMELESKSVLLLTAETQATVDDVIEIDGYKLRIMGMFPRHDIRGKLDHYQVEATFWSKA